MWMTLLSIAAIALVAIIVAIAVFYVVLFAVASFSVVFGVNVAWKKRKFFTGLIPEKEISAPAIASAVVEAGVSAAINAVQKKKKSPTAGDQTIEVKGEKRLQGVPHRKAGNS